MKNKLPEVVVFQDDENALNCRFKIPYSLGNEIAVKSIEYDLDDFKEKHTLIGNKRTSVGDVYFLHPYKDNTYVEQSVIENYLFEEKIGLYVRVAALLGAKSIETNVSLEQTCIYELGVDGKVSYKVVELGVDYKEKVEQNLSKICNVKEYHIQGEDFDLYKNLDEIYKMIKKYNLHHERSLINLIESRDNRESKVQLVAKNATTELTQELNQLYELSAKLSSPVFSLSAGFTEKIKKINTIKISLHFEF